MNQITLPENLLNEMIEPCNHSIAIKRKVGAIIFDNEYKPLSYGYNQNMVNDGICENNNKETFDTVMHAEQVCIFNFLKNNLIATFDKLNMLVSYSPCIECAKQIVLFGYIKNLYVYEEHAVNFRKYQYIEESMAPLDFLLANNINVFIRNKDTGNFEQIIKQPNKACIYHSKDLDGFMSRYLVEQFHPEKNLFKYIGYNYESDADWLSENYSEYLFIDVTPPIEWF